ncbi:paraquat-inducible protein A [Photobacterium ganghwense]|uniref:Paraquat-inducible protein A n=1 Tax=Photobacterium ganghwense TaxID=320778 RepID=A0A0J1JX48_9GAMM|nr:paraquat-inducible protein A [Photobacterium ganghwense]KLV06872.1 paraquat-inducible protein A [Photobacterium ganghwense]MBV1841365.1 paraquat-inducible protein A [Photobacterium ganghwense]PSU10595.1 paraquat-inducible protein A [Photobacterium ganghwense]QSV15495.1 paraquat-inducible protein A [Photobacterium ganghwense]
MTTARRCPGCDLPVMPQVARHGQSAYCPRCQTRLYRGSTVRFTGELAIACACLILFIPAHFFPLITIRLFGVMIPATLPSGTLTLASDFPAVALLILFCSSIAPFLVSTAVITAQLGLKFRKFGLFHRSLWILEHLKHWAMFDVFLVSLGVSCFKVQDYADIFVGPGLYSLVLLQLLMGILLARLSVNRYWEAWQPETDHKQTEFSLHCHSCHMTQGDHSHCVRCGESLYKRMPHSIQKTWAYLLAATVFIFPANLYPISIFLNNGKRVEDTIFSGVATLVKTDMVGIAIIIFVASIVVPVAKILGLGFILLTIQFKRKVNHLQRMKLYRFIQWIGKWSMMDLFVISIMVTLIDRDQLLDFTPGPGAIAFGVVVVLTMLAAESLDSRLIWDNYEQRTQQPTTRTGQHQA